MAKILRYVLAPARTVAGGAAIEGDAIVVSAGPHRRGQPGCPICGRRCECHDHEPTRRWRAMDLAGPECLPGCGPARAACAGRVPWARRGPGHARDLGDWVACLAAGCRVPAHPRIARAEWHSVGGICGRACDGTGVQGGASRLDGPGRAGIDETSHERGHKRPAAVVGHDRGCLVWAHEGYGREVPGLFLDEPAREQRRAIERPRVAEVEDQPLRRHRPPACGCRAELAGPGVEGGRAALAAAELVAPAVDHPPEVARLLDHPAVDPPRGHEPRAGPVAPPRAAREHGSLPMR